ncbi:MAG: ester cyclase [Chloroflexi bacterium]|nr:ester cyclase [Chloroflexota bacterium]
MAVPISSNAAGDAVERNKAAVRRSYLEHGHLNDSPEGRVAPEYFNYASSPSAPQGIANAYWLRQGFEEIFPDSQITSDVMLAEDDLVAFIGEFTATHSGPLMNIAATHKRLRQDMCHFVRFTKDGLVLNHWSIRDDIAFLRDMLPEPEGARNVIWEPEREMPPAPAAPATAAKPVSLARQGSGSDERERNRQVVRRWFMGNGYLTQPPEEFLAPDYRCNTQFPARGIGRELALWRRDGFEATWAEPRLCAEIMLAEADLVAFIGWFSAVHTGPAFGVAPTKQRVACREAHFVRLKDGLIVEEWAMRDDLELIRQIVPGLFGHGGVIWQLESARQQSTASR